MKLWGYADTKRTQRELEILRDFDEWLEGLQNGTIIFTGRDAGREERS